MWGVTHNMQNNTESRGKNRGSAARAAEILSAAKRRLVARSLSVCEPRARRGAHIRRIKNEFAAQKSWRPPGALGRCHVIDRLLFHHRSPRGFSKTHQRALRVLLSPLPRGPRLNNNAGTKEKGRRRQGVCEQASERAALAIKKGTNARGARLLYTTTRAREREREKEEPAARQHRLLQNSFLPAALASIASPISRGKILSLCIRWSEICMTR